MSNQVLTILTAGTAAVITVIGWNVSHYLAKKRDDRTRRIESSTKRIERQIEEFYGPLLSLINQIFSIWNVKSDILKNTNDEKKEKDIDLFVWREYFVPLHLEMRDLIKTKYYLADDKKVEESINKYLKHSIQELFQIRIEGELKIPTHHIQVEKWPSCFYVNALRKMSELRSRREELIQSLEGDIPSSTLSHKLIQR